MEDMEDRKEYELAFVAAGEDAAPAVDQLIAKHGGAITGRGPLAALKLAYQIKKHTTGFFGYVWFSALPANVKQLHDELAVEKSVLRFLIVTPPVKVTVRESRPPMREHGATTKPSEAKTQEKPVEAPKMPMAPVPEVLSNELLEKKLEEILK
ncbi:MAG: 30S ribosomal protein S6 [bacterium]|nr:30S ribosomal protein S6 [bacterium]